MAAAESPEDSYIRKELVAAAVAELTPREREVLFARAGVHGGRATLKELGIELGVGAERVRQIECRAIRKGRWALGQIGVKNPPEEIVGYSELVQRRHNAQLAIVARRWWRLQARLQSEPWGAIA